MRFLPEWLKALFRVEVTWIDRGQGKWEKQRHYHPVTRVVVIITVLTLAISWGVNFFGSGFFNFRERSAPRREAARRDAAKAIYPEPRIPNLRPLDFMPVSFDFFVPVEAPPIETFRTEQLPNSVPLMVDVDGDEFWIRINKSAYMLYLYQGDEVDRSFRIAVGRNPGDKQRSGDNRTPTGIFSVQSIENASAWAHDFRDGNGLIRGAYGPWFIRLKTGWKGIGIHGTHAPDSIGTMVSEGCIRMQNDELEELKRYAFKDMKVVIEE